jgi:hypothetical protein
LTARLEKIVLSEKMIEGDLSRVEESATKSTYRLGVGFERCEKKDEKSTPKFVPSSIYHKEEEALKPTKAHYPSNPNSSFNPKREARKETPKPREEAFVCMFCGLAGHLDEFCFRRKRIERRHVEYARDSYPDEFIDFLPRSYSHVLPRPYSRTLPWTFSRALPQFAHGPNHRSYGFGPRENRFEPRRFGYGPRPHRGDRFPRSPGFPIGGFFPHFEPRLLDGPRFPRHGKDRIRRPEGGEWEPIKIPRRNLAYIPKSTRRPSLLTLPRPHSYSEAIGP